MLNCPVVIDLGSKDMSQAELMRKPVDSKVPCDRSDCDCHASPYQTGHAVKCAWSPACRSERFNELFVRDSAVPLRHFHPSLRNVVFLGQRLECIHFVEPSERGCQDFAHCLTAQESSVKIEYNEAMSIHLHSRTAWQDVLRNHNALYSRFFGEVLAFATLRTNCRQSGSYPETGFWEVPPGFNPENVSKRGAGQPGSRE